jgi:glycosyltransferase involved in cell wall biosynthesis
MKEGYIPQDQRKKILLLGDDIRVHSGVAQVGREFVLNTCHRFNFACIAGAVKHPDKGKRFDISEPIKSESKVKDASVFIYPVNGYGDIGILRQVIDIEKPDAIFFITDPRYYKWLFDVENEFRTKMPFIYLNIWDDVPAPVYNKDFYDSCDALLGISKQTVNINKMVLGDKAKTKIIEYVPHGLNNKVFKPIHVEDPDLLEFKNKVYQGKDYEFTLLFNSRNIRRKSIMDLLLAWKVFTEKLPKSKAKKCSLLLKTDPVDGNGTDIPRVIEYLFPDNESNIQIIGNKLSSQDMSYLYNISDGVALLSSNEGWGLALTEALLTGTPFIANVTGGMQDQMRFEDDEGNWYTPSPDVPSNHRGTYKKHGNWAFPVYPTSLSLQGSPTTPYIFDDRCSWEDAAVQIENLYNLSPSERKEVGLEGYKWAIGDEAGFTSEKMSNRIIKAIDNLFDTWTPRPKYEFITDTTVEKQVLPHKLIY